MEVKGTREAVVRTEDGSRVARRRFAVEARE
jgi:hypothetical protein